MTRKELLETALKATTERGQEYGKPEDNFKTIASFWSVYLGKTVTAHDVAMMMVLFKTARAKSNPEHTDNLTDIAGYAACAAELEEKECGAATISSVDILFDAASKHKSELTKALAPIIHDVMVDRLKKASRFTRGNERSHDYTGASTMSAADALLAFNESVNWETGQTFLEEIAARNLEKDEDNGTE